VGPRAAVRALLLVAVIVLVRLGAFRNHGMRTEPWRTGLGLALFAAGLGLAIWARLHLGRNWGGPMRRKDDPELVTSGPYRLARHPIYTGILTAGTGTVLALDWTWLPAVAIAAGYFTYSAFIEERDLIEQFPQAYPRYRQATKMLVPFLL
jgi:protein-S-isoprenylcysteine O-methyltransferase Ste14